MKNFFKHIRLAVAFCATFLLTSVHGVKRFFNRVECFFNRVYLAAVIFVAGLVASVLEKLVVHVIQLKGLDLNPLPPALPEPTIDDVWSGSSYAAPRRQFHLPYMPSWVRASLKDPSKHPGHMARRPVEVLITVEEPLQATLPTIPEVSTGIDGHCEPLQVVNHD